MKNGLYETIYGNACEYEGGDTAFDIDSQQTIPWEMIDFTKLIEEL